VGIILVLCTIFLLLGHVKATKAKREGDDAEAEARRLIKRTCASRSERPVVYLDWYGTVHTFGFVNSHYCELFVEANEEKVVG
jgi:hypothetical protein